MLFPLQGAFLNDIIKANEQEANKREHFHESGKSKSFEIHCPRVHEDHFHVKQNKKDGYQEIFDGKRYTGIALNLNTTLESIQFHLRFLLRTQLMGKEEHEHHKANGDTKSDGNRNKIDRGTLN